MTTPTDNPLLTKLKTDLAAVEEKLASHDALKLEARSLQVAINALEKKAKTRLLSNTPRKNPWLNMTAEQKAARVALMNKAREAKKNKKPAAK